MKCFASSAATVTQEEKKASGNRGAVADFPVSPTVAAPSVAAFSAAAAAAVAAAAFAADADAVEGATGVDGGAAKGIGGGNGVREAAAAAAPRLPDAFFSSWVTVAAEEAKHFSRWRLRLLAAHATRYGDLPGHEGLWQSALDTRSSLLARLSVVHCVHEARGLDVAPLMRKKLGDDAASVAVLDGNVEEEVGHVGEGRRWIEYVCAEKLVPAADPRRVYQACVRKYFYGRICEPFAVEKRNRAGLTFEWYGPLAHEGVPRDAEELSAADMG